MATQYTNLLKLAQPTTGELDGTWGDVVNDNITAMIEEAIAGYVTIDTWAADAHTLTEANGTTAESRNAILNLTDTTTDLSGAGELICPDASKIYFVRNDTGQQITVKTSAGTGVAIADGQTTIVFCDGTNVVDAATAYDTLAEILAVGNSTGGTDLVVTAGDKITADTIDETTAAAGVTI
ncbi:MAG TPA: hypothetical protein VKP88_04195, partial [Candidatus Paceibacterota bacterium]|nr:hypothetical protein [Candidatus Paceibacterota bacterium]